MLKERKSGKRIELEREKICQSQKFEDLSRSETVKRKDKYYALSWHIWCII